MKYTINYFIWKTLLVLLLTSTIVVQQINAQSTRVEYEVELEIHEIGVIEDHDNLLRGAGDIYLELYVDDHPNSRVPQRGDVQVNDGEIWDVNTILYLSIERSGRIYLYVWDSDDDGDDSLGGLEILKINQTDAFYYTMDPDHATVTYSIILYERVHTITETRNTILPLIMTLIGLLSITILGVKRNG